MTSPDEIFKNKSRDFLDRVIYLKQFKHDQYKIIYHIINVCRPLINQERILNAVKYYVPNYEPELLRMVLENYIQNGKTLFRYQCFTHFQEVLSEEDLFFYRSHRKRYVTLEEYKFLLQRITKNLYESKNCKSVMVNEMFWKMKPEYFKSTGKKLDGHKLAYVFQVLQKHKYLHVKYNSKNQRVVQIGPKNPYYQIRKVPDINTSDLQDVMTKTEKEIHELKIKLERYERLREEDLMTIGSLQGERDAALAELENIKTVNQSLTEMHQEDIAEMEKLRMTRQSDRFCSNR